MCIPLQKKTILSITHVETKYVKADEQPTTFDKSPIMYQNSKEMVQDDSPSWG